MYSVLIQNQKTIDSFGDYRALFLEAMARKEMECCRWVESGETVETALPGLTELVADKEEWQAIIVRVEDESAMGQYETSPSNPYDFLINARGQGGTGESPVPLVRLTQMLGEIPAPEEAWYPEVVKDEAGKAPWVRYVHFDPSGCREPQDYERARREAEEKNRRARDEYSALLDKYSFDGRKPQNIIAVTFHCAAPKNVRTVTEQVWGMGDSRYSEFWKRNRYPASCRFVQYEYSRQGRVQKDADLFDFWCCVLLLAINNIDPSSLQAYRLYTIKADFDREKMRDCFQKKVDELKGCRYYAESEIRRDLEEKLKEKHPKPVYRMGLPVAVRLPAHMDVSVAPGEFGLCARSTFSDLNKWEGLRTGAEESLNMVYGNIDRALAESAERMRSFSSMKEEEVTPLDRFEKRDMENELSRIFDKILQTQNELTRIRNQSQDRVARASREVRKALRARPDGTLAREIGLLVIVLAAAGLAPGLLFTAGYGCGSVETVLAETALGAVLFCVIELVILWTGRKGLVNKIRAYNEAMEESVSSLTQDVGRFSEFISNITSYSRGKSFLKRLRYKRFYLESKDEMMKRHGKALNLMLDRMKKWCRAYCLPVEFDRGISDHFSFDMEVPPGINKLYTFETGKKYEIELNETGDTVQSPFIFVEKLMIEREELFEDAGALD